MSIQNPKVLYKYRHYDTRTINMLENNQVYFADPADFNDPFDCTAQKHMYTYFRENLALVLASLYLKVPIDSINHQQIQLYKHAIETDREMSDSKTEIEQILSEFNQFGVLSLSMRNDSILMWSHYANFHKGLCLGFTNNLGFNASSVREVIYSEYINTDFLFNFFIGNHVSEIKFEEETMRECYLTKHIDWNYEKEWRIVALKGLASYPEKNLDSVIFGLNMPQENRDNIKQILKNRDVKFFEAIKSIGSFAIEIKRIED